MGVVGYDELFYGEGVVGGIGVNVWYFVGCDGYVYFGVVEEDFLIGFFIFDDVSFFDVDVWVEGVVISLNIDVDNVIDL